MPPRLVIQPDTPDEQIVELRQGTTTIGRTRDNDVCVLHKSLSRTHARLDVVGGDVSVSDLGSKNGVSVDGRRVDTQRLTSAHVIKLGDVVVLYEPEPGAAARRLAPAPAITRSIAGDVTRLSMTELLGARTGAAPTALNLGADTGPDRAGAKLRILLKVSQLLSSPASLDALLASVLDLAFEILDIDRAAILLRDPTTGDFEARISRARDGRVLPDAPFSRSIASWVAERSVAALFSDAMNDPRLAQAGSVMMQSICTSMCAPLKPADQVLGVLYVDNLRRADRFREEDLEFLSAFANQAAIAMENARLTEKLASEAVARNNLLRFFPPSAVPLILSQGSEGLAPIETPATVLFSDISGFTEMSSRMKPTEVIALLNAYFPVMSEIVFRWEGTLEKYIGDALLAVWGAPIARPDDAVRAVRAAMEMQRAAVEIDRRLGRDHSVTIHVGLNSGVVAAGNIGSPEYVQYATIGDATNVASRICSVAASGEIVIDEATARALDGTGIGLSALGPTPLKGKDRPVELFRVAWESPG